MILLDRLIYNVCYLHRVFVNYYSVSCFLKLNLLRLLFFLYPSHCYNAWCVLAIINTSLLTTKNKDFFSLSEDAIMTQPNTIDRSQWYRFWNTPPKDSTPSLTNSNVGTIRGRLNSEVFAYQVQRHLI